MFKSIGVGLLMTVVTVGIHAAGTSWWIERVRHNAGDAHGSIALDMRVLYKTAVVLLLLHIVEVTMWAAVYVSLPNLPSLDAIEEAVYFSTVTFTTLGFGDIVIQGPWRMLAAIQAMAGLLIFGWSTALLVAVVRILWDLDSPLKPNDES